MFVIIVTYFIIITRVLRNSNMKNQTVLLMMIMMLLMEMETTLVLSDVELEVQNTQYTKAKWHVLSSHFQRTQADNFKERCKNKIIHTKAQQSCTTT